MYIDADLLKLLISYASASICIGFVINTMLEFIGYAAFKIMQLAGR